MSEESDKELQSEKAEIPSYLTGGRVSETGIALVHEGEYIMPMPGSEAEIEEVGTPSQRVVNYYFPVEVVIVGALPEEEREVIEARIWEQLTDALERAS